MGGRVLEANVRLDIIVVGPTWLVGRGCAAAQPYRVGFNSHNELKVTGGAAWE